MAHFSLQSSPFQMCVFCPNPITTMEWFFLHFMIALSNESWESSNEAMCSILFFWPKEGLQFVSVPNWVVWVFQWVLFHWQNHWTHVPFFYPYFILISNGVLCWTEIPLLISIIPMISIFFVYVHVFGTNVPFLFVCMQELQKTMDKYNSILGQEPSSSSP